MALRFGSLQQAWLKPDSQGPSIATSFRHRMWHQRNRAALGTKEASKTDVLEITSLDDCPEEKLFTFRFFTCLCIVCFVNGLSALDYSGTGNIMATIGNDLHATTTQVEWIGNGYSLGACVMQLPISALSDIFGRKALLITSLLFISVGSILSGTAQNMSSMIAGRVIQGVGGGGCYVLPEVIVADNVPLRQRTVYYSILMVNWAVFSGSAPLLAGALAQYTSWRWFFYLNLFMAGAAIVATPFGIRLKKQQGHTNPWWIKLKAIDYVGGTLTVAAGVSLLLGLSRGGSSNTLPWSNWSVILPIVLGFVGFGVVVVYELWRKPEVPMFNVRVFSNLSASICYLHNILQGIVNLCSLYFLPSFFQGAKGYGQVRSGACLLPLNLVGPPIVFFLGIAIDKTGHYHVVNIFMWAAATAGMALITLYNAQRPLVALLFLQVLGSIGINCLYATLSVTANATNPPHLWTESTAMMSFFRAAGDTFGTAIGGAVLASEMRSRLTDLAKQGIYVPDETNVLTLVDSIKHVGSPETQAALIGVLTDSFKTLFIVLSVFCGLSLALCFAQKEYSLDQQGEAKQGIDD